jgi:hypothetical protein
MSQNHRPAAPAINPTKKSSLFEVPRSGVGMYGVMARVAWILFGIFSSRSERVAVWTVRAAAFAAFFYAAPPTKAGVIAAAGAVIGNSQLPGNYYALYGTSPVGTSSNFCPNGVTGSFVHLPVGISIQPLPGIYTCSGGYSIVTPPGSATAIESGLIGVRGGVENVLALNIGSGAPTTFTIGIVTNVDPQLFDYPDALQLTSSNGGNSGVVATSKVPTGAVDTYLFTVTGAAPGETITLTVFQSTQNVPYGGLGAAIAGVTLNVITTPPVAADETATTNATTPVSIDLTVGATGNPTSAALIGTPIGGTASGFPDPTITFAPDPMFGGPASFQFTLANAGGTSNMATATISVLPVAVSQYTNTRINRPVTIDLSKGAAGNPTSAAIGTVFGGSVTPASGMMVTFTPERGFQGTASFQFTLSNVSGDSNNATANIIVGPPPAARILFNGSDVTSQPETVAIGDPIRLSAIAPESPQTSRWNIPGIPLKSYLLPPSVCPRLHAICTATASNCRPLADAPICSCACSQKIRSPLHTLRTICSRT